MKTKASRHNGLNLTQKIKLFGLTTLATVGATFLNIEPVLAQTVFATREIINLEMRQGNSEWRQGKIEQVNGARWLFYPNGTFVYAPANVREDLYPLQGTYQNNGNTLTFSGSKSVSIGSTGAARAEINGQIDFNNDQPVLEMFAASGASSGANINDTAFGFNNTSAYQTTVILYQVQ